MRVLVTGATGYLGQFVVRHLLAAGHSVNALIRKPADKALFNEVDCAFSIGDVRDLDSIILAVAGQDAIVHCAALVKATASEDFKSVNIAGTNNVVNTHDAQHLVLLSSVGVYGGPDEGPARNESTLTHPQNHYAASKLKAESVAQEGLGTGKKLTILRPTGFYGPARPLFAELVKGWQKISVIPMLSGDEIVQPCHVVDVCNVIERALAVPPERHRVLVVAGERSLGLRELYTELARNMDIRLRFIIIPAWFAVPVIRLLKWSGKISKQRSKLLLSRARGHSPGAKYDTSKAESELAISWVPLADGMREMAESLRPNN